MSSERAKINNTDQIWISLMESVRSDLRHPEFLKLEKEISSLKSVLRYQVRNLG